MWRIHNCWNRFGIEYVVWDIFLCYFFSCGQQLKITKLSTRENFGPTKKNLGPTKYPREKICYPQNTHKEKFRTHEIPKRKCFEPTKHSRDKILDPRNTHEGTRPTKFSTLTKIIASLSAFKKWAQFINSFLRYSRL